MSTPKHRPPRPTARRRLRHPHVHRHVRRLQLLLGLQDPGGDEATHRRGPRGVLGLVVWLLVNPVTAFVIPSEIGKMYKKDGQEPPFTGWTGLWLFRARPCSSRRSSGS